uniref:Uncharacterized protein n=1 Tax=Populus trichocarpa TaxID=3694 RepID=B9IQF0_POPTR
MEAVKVTAEADEEVLCPCSMSCRPCPPMRANVNIACLSSKTDGDPRLDVLDIGARLRLIVIKHLEDDELSTNRKKKRIERDRPDGKGPRLGQSFGHIWRHKGHGEHDAHIASEL